MNILQRIDELAKAGTQKIADHFARNYPNLTPPVITVMVGKKYARLVEDEGPSRRSAWAFVDLKNGDILKPASWQAPAKHSRGTVMADDFGASAVGPYGPAYLR